MWVKICGTTSLADAHLAIAEGADAIGFVFAPSKRRVDVTQVANITHSLPENIERVGVFQRADATEIAEAAREAGLTAVQLHFPHDAKFTAALRAQTCEDTKLLQVISCSVESFDETVFIEELSAAIDDPNLWGILLDASSKGSSGGTGKSFDWKRAAELIDHAWPQRLSGQGPKLILAGGLRQENVCEATAVLRPDGVDAVSGVEAKPGVKDPARVRTFVQNAKSASGSKPAHAY